MQGMTQGERWRLLRRLKARRKRTRKVLVGGQQDCSSGGCWGALSGHRVTPPTPLFALAERSNVLQRALNTLRFLWLLCQALVDGLTQWLDACTREHTDMSRILLLERCVLAQRLAGVSPGAMPGHGGGTARWH